jgi:hypothetical protein
MSMKPSTSTVASVGLGIPIATMVKWILSLFGVEMPEDVTLQAGVLFGAIVGYFFQGGKAADTAPANAQAGFVRPLMLAVLLSIALPLVVSMSGCTTPGLTQASSFSQKAAYTLGMHTAVLDSTTQALELGDITSEDATRVLKVADEARRGIDAALLASSVGDVSTAEGRLQLATSLLTELQTYLRRQP